MPFCVRSIALLALGLGMASISNAAIGDSGTGTTTRYWDCCKGSCSWSGKASVSSPVKTCSKSDSPLSDPDAASGCDGGTAYMCSDQSPWAESADLAYGFAAVSIPGGDESSWCCSCYELTFTSTSISGKKMIVQATNTGGDLAQGQFDLAIPGGGVGLFNACTDQYGAPAEGWGAQYGGISSNTCSSFPTQLQSGCSFRFGDFFEGAENPTVDWKEVTCPKALTDKTGCVRDGETPTGSGSSDDGSQTQPTSYGSSEVASSAAPTSAATSPTSSAVEVSSVPSAAPASSAPAAGGQPPAYGQQPPSYGTSVGGGVDYSSAAPSSSSSSSSSSSPVAPVATSSSPAVPVYGAGASSPASSADYAQPTGGNEQCKIEYVYVDGGSI